MKFEYIGAFRAGEAVPEWLLMAEPVDPGATAGFMFETDSHVFEVTDGYWIVNDVLAGKALVCVEANGTIRVGASGRTVIVAATMTVFEGPDDRDGPGDPIAPIPLPVTGEEL